jgi:RNA polymerase sigma-70 factor (ECF subfamily)
MTGGEPSAEERFDDVWRRHAGAVVRYARRRVLDAEVDEVVAETFLVAWRRLDDVPAFALPWLLGVARGVSANVHRGSRRRDALHSRLADHHRTSATVTAPSSDRAERVLAALAELREPDRELLTLVAWDGLTHDQAAEALGCSRRTFAVRLHRARGRLRAELEAAADHPATHPPVMAGPASPQEVSHR